MALKRISAVFALGFLGIAAPSPKRPFTAKDSIEMTQIVYSGQYGQYNCTGDGNRCAIVLRKGNLKSGVNEFTLSVLEANSILRFVNEPSQTQLPELRVLARFDTDYPYDAIDRVKWNKDGNSLTFIGRKAGKDWIGQVYRLDLPTKKLSQLTHHPYNVVQYALSDNMHTLVYAAKEPPDWNERNKLGYVIQGDAFEDVLSTDPNTVTPTVRYFSQTLPKGKARPINIDEPNRNVPARISLSPNGRWAIVPHYLRRFPAAWKDYSLIKLLYGEGDPLIQTAPDAAGKSWLIEHEFLGKFLNSVFQYVLIDVETGTSRPLLDAPTPGGPTTIGWAADSSHVLVGGTYKPLSLCGSPTSTDCFERSSALLDIELPSTDVRVVDDGATGIESIEWTTPQRIALISGQKIQTYDLMGDRWQAGTTTAGGARNRFSLKTVESVDSAPEISASDRNTGNSRTFTDLNPDFRLTSLGHVEALSWRSEELKQEFFGGLVVADNYDKNKRYPVVLQDYGFVPQFFLLTGPGDTAFSARALANRGMLVLNLGCWAHAQEFTGRWQNDGDPPRSTKCFESAIDELDRRGLIDRDRVGLIGFSATGIHIMNTITFSNYKIAAATIADSVAASPLAYAWMYGAFRPGMMQFERVWMNSQPYIGAGFLGKDINLWIQRSPAFHLDRIRTPLRYELVSYTPGVVAAPAYWDVYTVLKRMARPVEMIRLPIEEHNLQTPLKRFTSQQGNTDWFAFWLMNQERYSPIIGSPETTDTLKEQYSRWNKLKLQHEAVLKQPAPTPYLYGEDKNN